jgi:mRNA-degrading endonuclease RelE of RelBE toxin-antitoxin system
MRHFASPSFWAAYQKLPEAVRELADKNFALLKSDPKHPSLHFKKIDRVWSARIGLRYRVLATEVDGDLIWFWIGSHADYDALLR